MTKRTCAVDICDREAKGGYCDGHYARLRRLGDLRADVPLKVYSPRNEPYDQRVWRYVDKFGPIHPMLGRCWDWTGGRNRDGRGRFSVGNDHVVYAYASVYEVLVGPVPDGLHLDHLCRRPPCGTRVPDRSGDELDRWDEAICNYDYRDGVLLDDDLHALFSERRHGVRVIMISDSCHAGTVTRLAEPLGDDDRRAKFLAPAVVLPEAEFGEREAPPPVESKPRHEALLIAGAADWEFAFDASFNGRAQGAFTYVALQALKTLPEGATYRSWHAAIRTMLPSQDLPQTPMIFGTSAMKSWPVL